MAEIEGLKTRTAARFGHHDTDRLAGEEVEQLDPAQLATENQRAALISAVRMKSVFGDIQTNCRHLPHGRLFRWCSTPPLWHIDAVRERPTPSTL